jgi:hypothetical protein
MEKVDWKEKGGEKGRSERERGEKIREVCRMRESGGENIREICRKEREREKYNKIEICGK